MAETAVQISNKSYYKLRVLVGLTASITTLGSMLMIGTLTMLTMACAK